MPTICTAAYSVLPVCTAVILHRTACIAPLLLYRLLCTASLSTTWQPHRQHCTALLCTVLLVPLQMYVRSTPWPFYLSWGLSFGLLLVIACNERLRRR